MRHLSSALFILIMMLVFLPSCKKIGEWFGKKKVDTTESWLVRQDSLRIVDSIRKAQEALQALDNARLDSIRLREEAKLAFKYHIIVGSFYTPEYAIDLAEEYKKQGYNVRILKMKGSRFELVSAEAFSNFRTAVSKLHNYQEDIVLDAWMYIDD